MSQFRKKVFLIISLLLLIWCVNIHKVNAQIASSKSADNQPLSDSLAYLLKYFKENPKNEKIKEAAINAEIIYSNNKTINDLLGKKLLNLDSLLLDDLQSDTMIFPYTKVLAALFQELPQPKEHLYYASSLNNLGLAYKCFEQYENAVDLFQEALAIRKKFLGEKDPLYIDVLSNLAELYESMGLYKKALPLHPQILAARKVYFGEISLKYALSLNNLAYLHQSMGEHEKALPLFQQAKPIFKNVLGELSPLYASILSNIASVYSELDLFAKALPLEQQALVVRKKIIGENHYDYAESLNNLADIYRNLRQFEKARPLFEQSLEIMQKIRGEESSAYKTVFINLANLYGNMGMTERAISLLESSLLIRKAPHGEKYKQDPFGLVNLALLYTKVKQYEKASTLFQQAAEIRKNLIGEHHPDYAETLKYWGLNYSILNRNKESLELIAKANRINLRNVIRNLSLFSEQEKINLVLNSRISNFDILPSLLFSKNITDPEIIMQVYNTALVLKGIVLQDQQKINSKILQCNDSTTLQLYSQWKSNKEYLGNQLLLQLNERVPYIDSLENLIAELEQALSRLSATFNIEQKSLNITASDIKKKLSKDQASVEFIRFSYYNNNWMGYAMYAALLILPDDSAIKFIPLVEEDKLQRILNFSEKRKVFKYDSLYHLIWKPLEKYLTGINTIYYSPAGLLHRVAFQALKMDTNHLLIDKYQLNQVLSTKTIIFESANEAKPTSVDIWGDINYNAQAKHLSQANKTISNSASSFKFNTAKSSGSRGNEWNPLPGTIKEIDRVKNIFQKASINVNLKTGTSATEERFKALDAKSPQVIHFATHGFFLSFLDTNSKDTSKAKYNNSFKLQQNSMFRSGLVLAGANYVWKGKAARPHIEDGILTAYEIAQMDLSHTDIVVLSACETALGDLQGNEGVFGLQRAFKMAGVKQMILSLWKIPDNETMELMTIFYKNWLTGQTTRAALRSAQLEMKKKYSPYYWAGFVLVE